MLAWLAVMTANSSLSIKYRDEIEAYKKDKDQKEFGKKLDRQIKEEIDRFINSRK